MILKRWAVRQISSFLSDYLEGVSEQNLQASLNLAVGEVEIRHVRVQPELLAERHLELLSSDVSVSARIPWRNLGSEPTVFTVRDVWVEANAEPPPSSRTGNEAEQALQRWRTRRAREVQTRVEAALATVLPPDAGDAGGLTRSIATRLGHAALRQLQVRVDGLDLRLHSGKSSGSSLVLRCRRLALDEGGAADSSETTEVPSDVTRHPASLNKVFELSCLSASLTPGSDAPSHSSTRRRGGCEAQALRQELADRQAELARTQGGGAASVETRERDLVEVKGRLQTSLGVEAALPVVGPLSLGARLWHSSAAGLLWLALKLQIDATSAAVVLTPEVARFAHMCVDWYFSVTAAPSCVQHRSEAFLRNRGEGAELLLLSEYVELFTRRLRNDSYDEDRLQELEDLASIDWLVRCRLRCHEQVDAPAATTSAVGNSPRRKNGVLGWLQRRWRGRREEASPEQCESSLSVRSNASFSSASSTEDAEKATIPGCGGAEEDDEDDLDEEAGMEGMLPEVEEPHRVEVSCVIPLCDIVRCRLDAGDTDAGALRAVGGVRCRGTIVSAGVATGSWLLQAWDADVSADLLSLAVLLDSEPLMLLQQSSEQQHDDEVAKSESSCSFKSIEDDDEELISESGRDTRLETYAVFGIQESEMVPAVSLSLACAHKGGASASPHMSAPRWSVKVRLRQEPFRFSLAPWSLRNALNIVLSVLKTGQCAQRTARADTELPDAACQNHALTQQNSVTARDGASECSDVENTVALDLDLDVAAPVLRWGLAPQGQLVVALGRLLFRTCSVAPPPTEEITEAGMCTWQSFACQCQLTATSVAVHAESSECLVYKPTTICVRAWKELTGHLGWQLGVDSDVVQWTVTPAVLRAAGQMPLSLDYALAPLRDVLSEVLSGSSSSPVAEPGGEALVGGIVLDAGSTSTSGAKISPAATDECKPVEAASVDTNALRASAVALPDPEAEEDALHVKLHLCVKSCVFSWAPSDVCDDAETALLFKGIEVEYIARKQCVDTLGKLEHYELSYNGSSVAKCAEGGNFKVRNSDRHVALNGRSSMIELTWQERHIRGVLTTLDTACACLIEGQETAKGLFLVGDSAGMSAQLWSRFVNERIQAQLQHQAHVRLAELLPGLDRRGTVDAEDAAILPADVNILEVNPQINSDCSVEVTLCCDGVTAIFPSLTPNTEVASMRIAVTGAECVFRAFRSGDATADVSLLTMNLALRGRKLLTPRRAGKLLQVRIVRLVVPQPTVHWTASWAQVCILFRQRDYDGFRSFLQETVIDVLSSLRSTPSSSSSPVVTVSEAEIADGELPLEPGMTRQVSTSSAFAAPARFFRLDLGAPRVFLPTDKAMLRSPGARRGGGIGGGGGELVIDPASGEPGFEPEAGEGLMVFDFGHVTALRGSGSQAHDSIDLRLRGAHVLGITECGAPLREILSPLSVNAILKTGGPLEFHMNSIISGGEGLVEESPGVLTGSPRPVDHRMSFTRAQLTLLFDVIAENICYTGRLARISTLEQQAAINESTGGEWIRYAVEAASVKGSGFKFSWSWPGELVLRIAFTDEVPLVRFGFTGGYFAIENSAARSLYLLRCRNLSADDLRTASRNKNRSLLTCTEQILGGDPGFEVRSESPDVGDARTVIRLVQPVLQVLPQLLMDFMTMGSSSWQQCTFSRQNNQQDSDEELAQASSAKVDEGRCHKVEVNWVDGAFRVMSKWSETREYFEFAGSLFIALAIESDCIRTDRADLKGGCLRLRSLLRSEPSTLIPCLEWTVQGKQTRVDDKQRMRRHGTISLKPVVIRPYAIRITSQDHRAMVSAFFELLSFDADAAEPAEEIEGRDPLALQVESRFTMEASVEVQGAEVQILDEEGGHAWPGIKAHARTPLFDATIETRPGTAATVNFFTKEFEIGLSAHNHRLGIWEPVLPSCQWSLSHHMQRKPDGGPREVLVHSDVHASGPVALVVSPSTVHLAMNIFTKSASDVRYGHLLAGLNLSGNSFRITSEHSDECILEAAAGITPLDWLLKGTTRRDGKQAKAWLTLTILNKPKANALLLDFSRETSMLWDTGTAGFLVCQLIMLRPPQRILMVSSTVCVWNRTSTDLEVRFITLGARSEPIYPAQPCHTVDARCVDLDQSAMTHVQGACVECGDDGALRLGAGQMLSAPVEAQHRPGEVMIQVRPASEATGGIAYTWSENFPSLTRDANGQKATLCSAPPPDFGNDLPQHWLHLQSSGPANESRRDVDISAPLTIFNACPCDLFCWLNPHSSRTRLGVERDNCSGDLVILNGRGAEIPVRPGHDIEVWPIKLDVNGYFHYKVNGKAERAKPRWPNANCIQVKQDARRGVVDWICFHVDIAKHPSMPPRLNPQSALPVFDLVAEGLYVSFALKEHNSRATSWSLPLHCDTHDIRPVEEVVELIHKGMRVHLCTHRLRRQLVVYARCWFVNSTGLDVQVAQPGGPGLMHPVPFFGEKVTFLPELTDKDTGDTIMHVGLRGDKPITVCIPDIGGDEALSLTAKHPCCLRTERVKLGQIGQPYGKHHALIDISSRLVTLLPAILLFNKTDFDIGFRQVFSANNATLWLEPGKSGTFWWHTAQNHRMQITTRSQTNTQPSWSSPFQIEENQIGAYPLALENGPNDLRLLCISLDQEGRTFSVAVQSSHSCHMLINQHPSLVLTAGLECTAADPRYNFTVPYNATNAIAGKEPFGSKNGLHLILENVLNSEERVKVSVDLNRAGVYKVPLGTGTTPPAAKAKAAATASKAKATSTLRVPAHVTVELRNRVALVTIAPALDISRDNSYRTTCNLEMSRLCIAVLTEGDTQAMETTPDQHAGHARREAFTISLSGIKVDIHQMPNRRRDVNLKITDAQVVLQQPQADVVLVNATQPFLETRSMRDDVAMLDVHMRTVKLVFGELEVSLTDAAIAQARLLAHNLTPDSAGLSFAEILCRAGVPYHHVRSEPPPASSKLVLSTLEMGMLTLSAWCRIHLPDAYYIPKALRDTIQMVSLGNSLLDVKGAQVKLPQQILFSTIAPAEGSLAAVLSRVWDHYLPHVKSSWRSLVNHSNIVLGGSLSRHFWAPRERRDCVKQSPICHIGHGGELSVKPW